MKKITLFTISLLSVSVLFAGTGISAGNSLNAKNDFLSGKNNFTTYAKKQKKIGGKSDNAFQEGKIVITAGYGFPNWGKSLLNAFNTYDDYKVSGFGPLHFRGEYGLSDKIGLGLSINYVSFAASWIDNTTIGVNGNIIPYSYKVTVTSLSALARMNIHFATSEKLDPFWGIGVGYRTGGYHFTSNDPDVSAQKIGNIIPVGFETTIGLRYYFTDNIGAYVEMGLAKSLIQAGLAVAF